MRHRLLPVLALVLVLGRCEADEPADRADLARALQRFEAAWEARRETVDDATKRRAAKRLSGAAFAFFAAAYEKALVEIAGATAEVQGTEPDAARLRAPTLVALGTPSLRVGITG